MNNNKNSVFPSANCMASHISDLLGVDVPEGKFGFYQIGEHLVPYTFLADLEERFFDATFDHDAVISVRTIVGDEYWQGISPAEREVLPGCFLLLIEQGRIAIYFMDAVLD
jgi:hypothetical protein